MTSDDKKMQKNANIFHVVYANLKLVTKIISINIYWLQNINEWQMMTKKMQKIATAYSSVVAATYTNIDRVFLIIRRGVILICPTQKIP